MNRKYRILLGVFVGLAVLAVTASFYAYQLFYAPNILIDKPDVLLIIRPEANFKEVRDSLEKKGAINDMISFAFVSKILGYQDKVKPGRYLIGQNTTNLQIVRKLRAGDQAPVRVTLSNARLKKDIAAKLCKNLPLDSAELLAKLNTPSIVRQYGFDTATITAMFIPNTYEMYWTTTHDKLLERMHAEYKKFWNEKRTKKAQEIGLTPLQVSIMASIVEAEMKKKEEAKRIAGVYMNRLNFDDRKLRADPTVIYAIGNFNIKRLLYKDLEFDSPYNTYKYEGLPPSCICVPSIHAIDAVLEYEKHQYLFFCAKEDLSGYHNFAVTLAEHTQNAKRYQAALDQLGIRR